MPNLKKHPVDALLPLPLPMFYMLLDLSNGDRHGYALKREILQRTGGKMNLGSGVLYGSINKMLESKASLRNPAIGRTRTSMTHAGGTIASPRLASRWRQAEADRSAGTGTPG